MHAFTCRSLAFAGLLCWAPLAGVHAAGQVPTGEAVYSSRQDDESEVRRPPAPQDLRSFATPNYGLGQLVPLPASIRPQVRGAFAVQWETTELPTPRVIRVAPNGDLFVADSMFNDVRVLRASAGVDKPTRRVIFAAGLRRPYGIAFFPLGPNPRWVYIADSEGVVRFPYRNGDLKAAGKPEQIVVGVPTTHREARDMFSRNCDGMTVEPATGELWCNVDARDEVGDNTPVECATQVTAGGYNAADCDRRF